MLTKTHPDIAADLLIKAQKDVADRWTMYEKMAGSDGKGESKE
jgi:hypothetical protein